jgi:coenzyme F420-reducing hydrogenase gamma subunit
MKANRLKMAVFKLGSCSGCVLQLLNVGLPSLLKFINIAYFPLLKSKNVIGAYDVGLVEGSVSTKEHVMAIKKIRERSKLLIALGSCACFGGLQASEKDCRRSKPDYRISVTHPIDPCGIDEYVPVDFYLKGCPFEGEELITLLHALSKGAKPYFRERSVCFECKLQEIPCLMEREKAPCLGSITLGGCGAICPLMGKPCEGCRGPSSDVNLSSTMESFSDFGIPPEEFFYKLRKYAGKAFGSAKLEG